MEQHGASSATLEYAWEDHALSLLAGALGKEDDAREFARRGQFYRNLWNPATGFFQPRDSQGRFTEPFEPLALSYTDFKEKYTIGTVVKIKIRKFVPEHNKYNLTLA